MMTTSQRFADPPPDSRFGYLFRLIGDPVVEIEHIDQKPIVRTVNRAFEDVFGYSREAVLGNSLNEFIVPEERTDEATTFDQRTANGKYSTGVVTRKTATGTREFLYRGVPYERAGGQYAFAIYTDVTEQKEREQELQRKKERLDEFASMVSHDLRNPLNVANMHLDLARDEAASEHLARIDDALARMEEIIDDTLTLAQEGRTVAATDTVELSRPATVSWEKVVTDEATLSIESSTQINADPGRLKQVFENLFRNAVEHGSTGSRPRADDSVEDGGPEVTVEVGMVEGICTGTRCSPADRYAGFYVADDGPGIDACNRDAVFDPEYTTDGTGLGLAIVREIVDAHGWSIRVTDSVDGGARFEITDVEIEG